MRVGVGMRWIRVRGRSWGRTTARERRWGWAVAAVGAAGGGFAEVEFVAMAGVAVAGVVWSGAGSRARAVGQGVGVEELGEGAAFGGL